MAGLFIILMFLTVASNKCDRSVTRDEKTSSESHPEENFIDKKESCSVDRGDQHQSCSIGESNIAENKYSREVNLQWSNFLHEVEQSADVYKPCDPDKCNCHYGLIKKDLKTFKSGISQHMVNTAKERGTYYQIINHQLYRSKECMFPSRCAGVEHFILKLVDKLPDMDFVINTRDYPQVNKMFGDLKPIFSFSKTGEYADITYPAWTFWEGGPAISLYPRGLGRWDIMRKEITGSSKLWPWDKKEDKAFFRGSRTNSERDPLVYLSRKEPHLVDAQYTKNQAWKSDADTLYAPPAEEVSLSDHCHYKYLFNFRGVAASFRLKHLFLCGSLVFHVGEDWIEFFYPKLKPWVHYIPVPPKADEQDLKMLITFAQENSEVVEKIASQGQDFIIKHLRMKDVLCYWKKLLTSYATLLNYKPIMDQSLIHIRVKE